MGMSYSRLIALLLVALNSSCLGVTEVVPVPLYGGAPKPASEISGIKIVKTHPTRGHPTLIILKITRLGDSTAVVFQAPRSSSWAPPDHFGGPPPTAPHASLGTSGDPLAHVEVLPGSYQIVFLYAPVPDKWGWTHQSTVERTTVLDCRAGYTYLLEGKLLEGDNGWLLDTTEVPTSGGETWNEGERTGQHGNPRPSPVSSPFH